MSTRFTSSLALSFFTAAALHAQFTAADIQHWVGTGQDTAVLVVDFQDGSPDPAYAWGYLHNGGTAADMLDAIVAADDELDVSLVSGFLNDLMYGTHAGLGGAPDYWSTWTGTSIADMAMNDGLSEPLVNGLWFGCSYTDFDPALPPTEPVAAPAPDRWLFCRCLGPKRLTPGRGEGAPGADPVCPNVSGGHSKAVKPA